MFGAIVAGMTIVFTSPMSFDIVVVLVVLVLGSGDETMRSTGALHRCDQAICAVLLHSSRPDPLSNPTLFYIRDVFFTLHPS